MGKVVTAVVLTFIATSLLWLGGIVAVLGLANRKAAFEVELEHPLTVTLGEEFDLLIHVTNPREEAQSVASVDVFDEVLAGLTLVAADPTPSSQEHVFRFRTLWLSRDLDPGETGTIRLRLRPVATGPQGGQVDVCTRLENCTSAVVSIEVAAAQSAPVGLARD